MTEPTRLPGVKGSWILCFECPPTKADCDSDCEVRVFDGNYNGAAYAEYGSVFPAQYWRPGDKNDRRPFTLPSATPTPPQPAAGARKFVQLTRHNSVFLAVADDGTAWMANPEKERWIQLPSLPDREAP